MILGAGRTVFMPFTDGGCDHYTSDGWDQQLSISSCEFIESQYMVSGSFIEHPSCPTDNVVGECDLPAGGDFAYPVTLLYDSSASTGSTPETVCMENDGVYYSY